ncbi:MAG: ligase-associated DNA damage response DEXH box helicase [Steroidobacteraceae bacterium]
MPDRVAERLHKARAWFATRGRQPFEFQEATWTAYWRGSSGLLNAGTGMGKTLAAWLGPLIEADDATARPGVRVLWVTPLRALARDLEGALREPLDFLGSRWRVEQRTGDTSSARRARQKTHPPETLITTPESLSLLLSYGTMLPALSNVDALIVDEWHEFLGNKRGVQMELVAARLRTLSPALRIWGLSATLPDLPGSMRTLLGPERSGELVRAPATKRYQIEAILPASLVRFPWAGHLGLSLLPDVIELIGRCRSTLVFTNTRSQAELWYQALVGARLDWLTTTALHHGSIDAKIRRKVEEALKSGALRCVVCTSSLDLGVDFPPVDQVVQIGSPKGIARLLQRAGRSGHQPGESSRVTIVPTHALELLECAAVRHAAQAMDLEPRRGMTLALDVLAQHLVTLAVGAGFDAAQLLDEVRATHAFARLTDVQWRWILEFITRGGSALQAYPQFRRASVVDARYVVRDAGLIRRHRQSIGTITSNASIELRWLKGGKLGQVEESFVARLRPNDVFVFGGRSLRLARLRDSIAYVRLVNARSRYVPRWQGARMPLSTALGRALLDLLGRYRRGSAADPEIKVLRPLLELQSKSSAIPGPDDLLIETMTSREGFHVFVYPFAGRLLNEGVASVLSLRAARETPRTFSITSNEYGFELLCEEPFEITEACLRRWLSADGLIADLLASVDASDLARRQFRDIARIAGLVDPGTPRRGKTARQLQASSGLMFDVLVRHDSQNMLLDQARREVLEAQLDHIELKGTLERLARQRWSIVRPARFTPLSFPLWADRLQTQTLSTESWQTRVEREARRLERLAR